ncbi:molybdate ABC transporter substrate-binding protein [Ramlibacter sp.]|uniref:molybdate ABC transporter substrate-binding protein n=1 Tax=Ramlibacter sp. TaxID=1917967 RepID=UPI00257EF7DF|nr:molybdate ABC transporter substrate-binding protein [Ramlibacter sp.]
MRFLPALALLLAAGLARAGEVQLAVAANFAAPMARIAQAFTAATGHAVRITPGATGKFRAQVQAGAPFDVLLAADEQTPRFLEAQGLAVPGTRFTYALGRLALWSATPGLVDAQGAVLATGRFRHLAIANPRLAPYGEAAMQVLHARGLEAALADRLVVGESIAQAFQFVASGNAELGFVALSQVSVPGKPAGGSLWPVPADLHAPIRQDAVLLQPGAANPAARALLDWLRGPSARAEIQAWGYGLP